MHINIYFVLLLLLTVAICAPRCPLQNNQNIPYLVAIVDCTLVEGLGNIAQENTTADILIEDQLQPPFDMVIADQEHELHKPNSCTKRESFIVV